MSRFVDRPRAGDIAQQYAPEVIFAGFPDVLDAVRHPATGELAVCWTVEQSGRQQSIWPAADPDELADDQLVYRYVIRSTDIPGEFELQLSIQTKDSIDAGTYLKFSTPSDSSSGCKYLAKFSLLLGKPALLSILGRGVAKEWRQAGLMTQTSLRLLDVMQSQYGEMEVDSSALHVATALFFATSDMARAAVLALPRDGDGTLTEELDCCAKASDILAYHRQRAQAKSRAVACAPPELTAPQAAIPQEATPKPALPLGGDMPEIVGRDEVTAFAARLDADTVLRGTSLERLAVDAEQELAQSLLLVLPGVKNGVVPMATSPAWYESAVTDLAYGVRIEPTIRQSPKGEFVISGLDICMTLASKYQLLNNNRLGFCTPSRSVKHAAEEVFLVMRFVVQNLHQSKNRALYISDRGVHQALRGKQLMTRASINALLQVYATYGDMLVTSYAIHVATALFFATTPEERARLKAEFAADPDSFGYDGRKQLSELLAYHCARLDIPFMKSRRFASAMDEDVDLEFELEEKLLEPEGEPGTETLLSSPLSRMSLASSPLSLFSPRSRSSAFSMRSSASSMSIRSDFSSPLPVRDESAAPGARREVAEVLDDSPALMAAVAQRATPVVDADAPRGPVPGQLLLTNGQ